MFRTMSAASMLCIALVGLTESALAGSMAVPAPIVGAGLPLLLAAAGVYVAVKLVRARRRD